MYVLVVPGGLRGAIGRAVVVVTRRARALLTWVDKIWDSVGRRLAKKPRVGDAILATVVVLYLSIDIARRGLDAGIAKVHPSGVSGVSTNSLHDGAGAIDKAFTTWAKGYERLHDLLGHRPINLAIAQTVLEFVLVPLSFVVWYGIVKALRTRVEWAPIDSLLQFSAVGVIAYVVLGAFDQAAELAILLHGRTIAVLDGTLHGTGLLRSALLPLYLLPILIGLIQVQREKKRSERLRWWRTSGTTYRVLLVVVGLHAALLLFSIPGAQSEDALRLWLGTPRLAVTGLVFTSTLSVSLATIALRLGSDAAPKRIVLGTTGTKRLAVTGAVLAAIGVVARSGPASLHRQPWGAGALSAGLLTFVVAVLSWPLAPSPTPPATGAVDTDRGTTNRRPPTAEPMAEPTENAKRLVPAILALAPLTTLALAMIRASMPSIMDSRSSGWLIIYGAVAGALGVVGFCLVRAVVPWTFKPEHKQARTRLFVRVEVALAAFCLVVYVWTIRDPWNGGDALGLAAIVATFLTAIVVVFGTLGYLMESKPLPAALDFVGFRRLPVIVSLIAWGVVSHQFAKPGYHDLQTMTDTPLPATAQITVDTAFDRWVARNLPGATETDAPADTRPAVPLVFVAAAGGGIKAAAFTSATIDCVFLGAPDTEAPTGSPAAPSAPQHPCVTVDAWPRLFAASGASGGSVGIASVLAERERGPLTDTWISDRLGKDLLSPEVAWQLFVELPNAVASFNPSLDRGEVLQESWRREFADASADPGGGAFYTDMSASTWTDPLVFFSGTNLNDGCRVNISAARSAERAGALGYDPSHPPLLPADATRRGLCKDQRALADAVPPDQASTRDLLDYLCGDDIDLATAAFLSARFPEVSPTGTIRCSDTDPETSDSLSIGDAGYRDNSGAASIMDTWSVLEPIVSAYNARHDRCIVPVFVEINNGYAGYTGPTPPTDVAQLVAPILGAAKVFSDLSYGPIEQAAAEFSRPLSPDVSVTNGGQRLASRFFRVSLVDHPGVTAPLGWSLSRDAVEDLIGQLDLPENKTALDGLRALLDPGAALACQRA